MAVTQTTTAGGGRKARFVTTTLVALLAATAILITANILGTKYSRRFDLTEAGDQKLAPRTERVLNRVDKPFRIVIAADKRTVGTRSWDRTKAILRDMKWKAPELRFSMLDLASPADRRSYRQVVQDLIDRDNETLAEQSAAIDRARGAITSLSLFLNDTLSRRLLEAREAFSAGTPEGQRTRLVLENAAAAARIDARELAAASARAAEELKAKLDETPLPATDRAVQALVGALEPALERLTALQRDIRAIVADPANAGPPADGAVALIPVIDERRDQTAILLDSLHRLPTPDVLRITAALKDNAAALVIGPSPLPVRAVPLDRIFPRTAEGAGRDASRRTEDALATALAVVMQPVQPIVVLVHGETRYALVDDPQRPGRKQVFGNIDERLRSRGIDLVEWPAGMTTTHPSLAALDPEGVRPVVYATLPPNSAAAAGSPGELNGMQRAARLGEVVGRLVAEGKPVLFSIAPSIGPTYGDPDPTAIPLQHFGLNADSGRPLLTERITPQGRLVETDRRIIGEEGQIPLNAAVQGLATFFPWPIALLERPTPSNVRVSITPLYTLPADASTWCETQWLRWWQTPRDQRMFIPDAPKFDETQDSRWPLGRQPAANEKPQRWIVAAAAERFAVGLPTQRAVVVSSNGWYADAVTELQADLAGQIVPIFPGNIELFEASIMWLAGQDELIAQSAASRAVPVIKPLDDELLARLRLGVVLGLPAAVLLLGLVYRLIRR